MIESLRRQTDLNFSDFTFLDLGSGKGRMLLMACQYPFRRIVGVELLPELHRIAQENLLRYQSEKQQCFKVESVCADASAYVFPPGPMLLYLFNPFREAVLQRLTDRLEETLRANPRPVFVLYHNSLLEHVLSGKPAFVKIGGTHQYSIFQARANLELT